MAYLPIIRSYESKPIAAEFLLFLDLDRGPSNGYRTKPQTTDQSPLGAIRRFFSNSQRVLSHQNGHFPNGMGASLRARKKAMTGASMILVLIWILLFQKIYQVILHLQWMHNGLFVVQLYLGPVKHTPASLLPTRHLENCTLLFSTHV
jgi:hypothetical protein